MAELVKTSLYKKKFLEAFASTGAFYLSARAAGVVPQTVYRWINGEGGNHVGKDETFIALYEAAKKQYLEVMETEADRRGREGVDKPVFQGKELVGYIREYSDTMMIFRLKALAPEKYRERQDINQNVSGEVKLKVVYDSGDKREITPGLA